MRYFTPRWQVLWAVFISICLVQTIEAKSLSKTHTDISPIRLDSTITDVTVRLSYDCEDDTNITATAIVEGGILPLRYTWSTGDSTAAINNLAVGNYTLTVTDSLDCIFINNFVVQAIAPIEVTEMTLIDATCQGSADGQLIVAITGGTPDYSLRWSTGADSTSLTQLNPGQYFLTVTDASGCSVVDTTVIGQTNELSVSIVEQLPASGPDVANGVATAAASGGSGVYTFTWDNGIIGTNNLNLAPGTHSVTVTDSIGCIASTRFTTIFSQLNLEISAFRNARCLGSTDGFATVDVTDGTAPFNYNWSTGDSTDTASGLGAGTYTVTVIDANGLQGEISTTILDGEPIFFNASVTQPTCPDRSNGWVRLAATGGQEPYLYDIGIGITPVGIVGGVSPGVKRYRIFSSNGCTADTVFTLEPLSPGDPIPDFQVITNGNRATFTNTSSNEPTEYIWDFGDGDSSRMENPVHIYPDTGIYEVCLTAINFCDEIQSCQQIVIDPNQAPGVQIDLGRDTSGLSGTVVQVPIIARTLDSLVGIRGELRLTDTTVASIVDVSGFNLSGLDRTNFNIQPNQLTTQWSSPNNMPIDLSSGTSLFFVHLLLEGDVNTCTSFDPNSEIDILTLFQDSIVEAPLMLRAADICISRRVSISGQVQREFNESTGPVQIALESSIGMMQREIISEYEIDSLPGGVSYTITPTKGDDLLAGVTTMDAARILMHILLQGPLETPYRIIAADIDNSGSVNSLDLVYLQRLILQQIDFFPNNTPWRFVPESYSFINPQNPVLEDFPESIFLERLEQDVTDADFVSIKVGDVAFNGTSNKVLHSTNLHIKDRSFKEGEHILVPVTIASMDEDEILGFQAALEYDTDVLEFKGIADKNYLNIGNANLGMKAIKKGKLKMAWLNTASLPIEYIKEGHFQLEFVAKKKGLLSEQLYLSNDGFRAELYSHASTKNIENHLLRLDFANETNNEATKEPFQQSFMMTGEQNCNNGIDDDGDGLMDCADADCFCSCQLVGVNCVGPCDSLSVDMTNSMVTPACGDANTGSLIVAATNGTPPYSYDLNGSMSNAGIYSGLFAGDLILTIQDSIGCTLVDTINIPGNDSIPNFEYTLGTDSLVFTDISDNMPTSWAWTFGDTSTSNLQNPILDITGLTGMLEVCLTTSNRCGQGMQCQTIQLDDSTVVSTPLSILLVASEPDCNAANGAINVGVLGGTAPFTFMWSDTTLMGDSLTNLQGGVYVVTVTDAMNNMVVDSIELQSSSSNDIVLDENATQFVSGCEGEAQGTGGFTLVATGGTAPYTYDLNGGISTTGQYEGLFAGTYFLRIEDAAGCVGLDTITLPTTSSMPEFTFTQTVNEIRFTDISQNSPTVWDWMFGDVATSELQNPALNVMGLMGALEVCLTTTNRCGQGTQCQTIQIGDSAIVSMPLAISLSSTNPDCNATNGMINVGVTGGTAPYTFMWSDTTLMGDLLTNLQGGVYVVTVTDAMNNMVVDSIELQSSSSNDIVLDENATQFVSGCEGEAQGTGSITLVATGGTAPYTYDLNGGISTTGQYGGLFGGNYFVRIEDAAGCIGLDTIALPITSSMPAFTFTQTANEILFMDASQNSPTVWDWTFGDVATSISPNPALNVMGLTGVLEVCLTTTNRCGQGTQCQAIELGDSTVTPMPLAISLSATNPDCNATNGMINVEVTGGTLPYAFMWNDTTLMGDYLTNLQGGVYVVTVTDAMNNTVIDSVELESVDGDILLDEIATQITAGCEGEMSGSGSINLVATGGTLPYIYSLNGDTSSTGNYTNLLSGGYFIRIEDANGCVGLDTVEVPMIDTMPTFTFTQSGNEVRFVDESQNSPTVWAWTFGDTATSNLQNPSFNIDGLSGMIEVCLTTTNACGSGSTCQSIMIQDGGVNPPTGPISLTVDDLIMVTTDTVIVPVRASDFINVLSYQHSIQLSDTIQSSIVGISGMNLDGLTASNFFQINDHSLTTVWFDQSGTGVTVPNGTILYNIIIVKNNLADDCIEVSINGNIIPIQVVVNEQGMVVESSFEVNNGSICSGETSSVFGRIRRETGAGVPDVMVNLTNELGDTITAADGFYSFNRVMLNSSFDIVPSRNTDPLEDVSTFDIVLINRHILQLDTLDSPYKLIAADVNASNTITSFDLVLIQRLILNLSTEFLDNTSWRFVPADYVFPDPTNPFAMPLFPEVITVDPFMGNLNNQDFIAIKVGDVSYSINNQTFNGETASRSANTLNLQLEEQRFERETLINVPVTLEDLNNYSGFQLELTFDPNSLELLKIENRTGIVLGQNNISYTYIDQGRILLSWIAPSENPNNPSDGTIDLAFRTKQAGQLSDLVKIGNRYLHSEAYTQDLKKSNIGLVIQGEGNAPLAEIKVYPNPTSSILNIDLPEAQEISEILLYNITGQLVLSQKNVDKSQQIQLDLSTQSEGAYLLVLKGDAEVIMRQHVLLSK